MYGTLDLQTQGFATPEEYRVAGAIQNYLANYVKNGDPGVVNGVRWPRFEQGTGYERIWFVNNTVSSIRDYLTVQPSGGAEPNYCGFWNDFYRALAADINRELGVNPTPTPTPTPVPTGSPVPSTCPGVSPSPSSTPCGCNNGCNNNGNNNDVIINFYFADILRGL
eukprot:TRINITY_DN1974_c0_g1_i1.p1 TRINITY_DN1974_c0_g1~~TRINITY_DN1974_c0_g1_i1.p1  ORF type:complete len:166 (-),score=49.77 TRINITY_DN1974_c0_g1_i1:62-559(-)